MAADIRLVLVRHAIAEERGPAWPDDDERPLSREGMRKWKQAAGGLALLVPRADALLASPLVRTCQTAEVLAQALGGHARLEPFAALRPDTRIVDTIAALKARPVRGTTLLVGHEPLLSELASTLLHLHGALEFKKGAAMAMVTQGLGARGPARLEWFVTPRMLRDLKR